MEYNSKDEFQRRLDDLIEQEEKRIRISIGVGCFSFGFFVAVLLNAILHTIGA